MMMAICSVLTKLSDEDCADERLKTLWGDLKSYDERMYRRARYGVVGFFTNLRGRAGDKTTLGLYRLAWQMLAPHAERTPVAAGLDALAELRITDSVRILVDELFPQDLGGDAGAIQLLEHMLHVRLGALLWRVPGWQGV